ncbi:MAG: peptidyl-prolyl cis-trans isomerase [Bacteroidales bacterium]|nr:peptidyl-prolyl cis-trans isomerase [Bacteroidales bacterium]
MYKKYCLLIFLLSIFSCTKKGDDTGKTPVAEYKGQFLYKEDLESVVPQGISGSDSLDYVNSYIKNWVEEALLYEKARNNIEKNDEINNLVEQYRRSLIVYQYQQQLLNNKVKTSVSDDEVMAYYKEHFAQLILEESLIKGLFLKLPVEAPKINQVREWYCNPTPKNLKLLEKYTLQNAVDYDYFVDKWVVFDDVKDRIPYEIKNNDSFIQNNDKLEVKDSSFIYFLYIDDYLLKGQKSPYEYALASIRETLLNQRKMDFMKEFMKKLYEKEADNVIITK